MSRKSWKSFCWAGCIIVGFAAAVFGGASLQTRDALKTGHNPLSIKGSAYGRLLARLSESTVDRVWHLGVEQVIPHGEVGHECGEHCDHGHAHSGHAHAHDDHGHDHDDHGHDHSGHAHAHDDRGHDHSAHAHDEHEHGHDHDEHAHDHSEHAHAHDDHGHDHSGHVCDEHCDHGREKLAWFTPGASSLELGKNWLSAMRVTKYKRTNSRSLSQQHLASVKKDVETMLLRSYQMDPTHYGVYNSYHLFLTTHEFGGTESSRKYARTIANATYYAVSKETEDPEPWLTAASAAMNLYEMDAAPYNQAGDPVPLELLEEYENKVGYCLQQFNKLIAASRERGDWDNLSTERQLEIAEHARFAARTFEQFPVMIARAKESPKEDPVGEVATSPSEE